MARADCIHLDGRTENDCQPESLLERVEQGQLVILRKYLQELKVYEQLQQVILSSVDQSCGIATAARVKADGIEKIHLHLDVNRIEEVYTLTRAELDRKMPAITAEMFRRLGASDPFYVHSASLIRLMMPYGFMKHGHQQLQKHLGKLVPHPPHHDHYQNVPTNAINTWIAMGLVREENSMFIYPEIWGKNLPQDGDRASAEQYLGRPISIAMKPGDALLFHSNHLHATRLNTTDETRVVLTNRVCLSKPSYPNPLKPQRYFMSSGFERELELEQIFSIEGFVGSPDKVLTKNLRRFALLAIDKLGLKFRSTPKESPNLKQIPVYSPSGFERQLSEGQIAVVDEITCATRLGGEILLFHRRCPHEGADLAFGFIENGKVICPWHGLQFCPISGESNCDAIPPLRTGIGQVLM
jgi:nitrite reductase/ring-hydroxylating ferredoxin subunit